MNRRKSGAHGTTARIESDIPEIASGIYNNFTTGAPITILFENNNIHSADYSNLKAIPRPGQADFVADKKYNSYNDPRGGGHFSGRITLGLVAAGVIAKKIISPICISSQIIEIGGEKDYHKIIDDAVLKGNSVGGIIECTATNMPIGLGEPFFCSVESLIAQLAFSIPAIKGIEFGSGFESARMKGSEHNDIFISTDGKTKTNNSGGINGGITNGNDIVFRVAVKPTASISIPQETMNMITGKMDKQTIEGRHDACIALRMPVIIEAITAIALADLGLIK